MVFVTSKYNEEFIKYIKNVGGKWNPELKAWDVPEDSYDAVRYKANDLGIELRTIVSQSQQNKGSGARGVAPAESAASQKEGRIWLGRSRDGKYLIMRINLLAFAEDVQAVLNGTKKGARFRVMPANKPQKTNQ
ncbi:MAG: hypothetical protein QXP27_00350 [Candidatus Methanomethyliaceae archaeon]